MCGDNKYGDDLEVLTAMELYSNADFYSKPPYFILLISKY